MRSLYGVDGIDETAWERAMSAPQEETCDRRSCHALTAGSVTCADCGEVYRRCEKHGSAAGARRSLHSHRAVFHPAMRKP